MCHLTHQAEIQLKYLGDATKHNGMADRARMGVNVDVNSNLCSTTY